MDGRHNGDPVLLLSSTSTPSRQQLESRRDELLKQRANIDRQLLDVYMLMNSQAAVNRLPPELLLRIFSEAKVPVEDGEWHTLPARVSRWYGLMGVCRTWRTITCGSPLLWREIGVWKRMPIRLFRLFLKRASAAPVDVTFVATRKLWPYFDELERKLPQLRRVGFSMLPPLQAGPVSHFLEQHMPALESLTVTFGIYYQREEELLRPDSDMCDLDSDCDGDEDGGGDDDNDNDDSFSSSSSDSVDDHDYLIEGWPLFTFNPGDQHLPHLSELCLRNVELDNLEALSPSLETLTVSNCWDSDISIHHLLGFLSECKSLKSLTLRRYRFSDPDREHWSKDGTHPLPVVALPEALRYLFIQDAQLCVARLLSAVSVPVTAKLLLGVISPFRHDDDDILNDAKLYKCLDACLPRDRGRHVPHLGIVDGVHLNLARPLDVGWQYELSGYVGPDGERELLTIGTEDRVGYVPFVMDELINIFGDSPVVELKLTDVPKCDMQTADWAWVLGRFSMLRRLAVVCTDQWDEVHLHPAHAILHLLGTRQPDGSLQCPDLTDLALTVTPLEDHVLVLHAITRCLEARKAYNKPLARIRIGIMDTIRLDQEYEPWANEGLEAQYNDTLGPLVDVVECGYDCDWGHYRGFWKGHTVSVATSTSV